MTLGEFVKSAREARGLKKFELAAIAGMSPSYLGRIESDNNPKTSVETLTKLAKALDVPFDKLKAFVVPNSKAKTVIFETKRKTPFDYIRDLTSSLPNLIPVYAKLGDKKAVEYAFLPQPTPTYRGKDMKLKGLKSNIKFKDEIKPGDIIIVAEDMPCTDGDLCVKDKGAGLEVCKSNEGGIPVITIIRYKKRFD